MAGGAKPGTGRMRTGIDSGTCPDTALGAKGCSLGISRNDLRRC